MKLLNSNNSLSMIFEPENGWEEQFLYLVQGFLAGETQVKGYLFYSGLLSNKRLTNTCRLFLKGRKIIPDVNCHIRPIIEIDKVSRLAYFSPYPNDKYDGQLEPENGWKSFTYYKIEFKAGKDSVIEDDILYTGNLHSLNRLSGESRLLFSTLISFNIEDAYYINPVEELTNDEEIENIIL